MAQQRFSRAALAKWVWEAIQRRERDFGFDPQMGSLQVERQDSKMNREYGEYEMLRVLVDVFDLEVPEPQP